MTELWTSPLCLLNSLPVHCVINHCGTTGRVLTFLFWLCYLTCRIKSIREFACYTGSHCCEAVWRDSWEQWEIYRDQLRCASLAPQAFDVEHTHTHTWQDGTCHQGLLVVFCQHEHVCVALTQWFPNRSSCTPWGTEAQFRGYVDILKHMSTYPLYFQNDSKYSWSEKCYVHATTTYHRRQLHTHQGHSKQKT